jgi:hypothetical protein
MIKIQSAMNGLGSPIRMLRIAQTIENAIVIETETPINFVGVVQPLSPKQLSIKPEGERAWKWLQIHTATNLSLNTGDRIKYGTTIFKIRASNDYSLNGYYEYHIQEDYARQS